MPQNCECWINIFTNKKVIAFLLYIKWSFINRTIHKLTQCELLSREFLGSRIPTGSMAATEIITSYFSHMERIINSNIGSWIYFIVIWCYIIWRLQVLFGRIFHVWIWFLGFLTFLLFLKAVQEFILLFFLRIISFAPALIPDRTNVPVDQRSQMEPLATEWMWDPDYLAFIFQWMCFSLE